MTGQETIQLIDYIECLHSNLFDWQQEKKKTSAITRYLQLS